MSTLSSNSQECKMMKQVKNDDIWVNDLYLRQGIENLLQEKIFLHSGLRFVFFTIDNYYNVKKQNYDHKTHRLIFLTQGTEFRFLNDFDMHRIDARSSLDAIRNFITRIAHGLENSDKLISENITLTARDRILIEQLSAGKKVVDIANMIRMHIKTVYQIRHNLIRKLGCNSLVEFLSILKNDVFKSWLVNAPVV